MNRKLNKRGLALKGSQGFTLIEVTLVLALAGVIMTMAFLAYRQASANRRDTQRRADANRIITELQNYYGDKSAWPEFSTNKAACATDSNTFSIFIQKYLCDGGTSFLSPDGTNYNLVNYAYPSSDKSTKNNITFLPDYRCGSDPLIPTSSPRSAMIIMGLEKGSPLCKDIK